MYILTKSPQGVPPATVAEWTLQGDGNRDFYDGSAISQMRSTTFANLYASVSLVDGYNLPMAVTNSANCPVADCPVDLGPNCENVGACLSHAPHASLQVPHQYRARSTRPVSPWDARALAPRIWMVTQVCKFPSHV